MQKYRWILRVLLIATLASVPVAAATAQTPPDKAQTPPDNTKTNTRDRAKGAVTADQQKENAADRELTQKIRRAVMEDKSLSTYAHNVKIVSRGGQVTLKGPVRSDEERRAIEAKATELAGAGRVANAISVAPAKQSKP